MNNQKIDFIIAYNQERAFQECVFYIEQLNVPDGYEIGLLSISEGTSMAAAYNVAMAASDAKYKVYLHQDLFIWNRDFISDILGIFQSNEDIGMIGVLGGVRLPTNGVYFTAWNIGRVKADNAFNPLEVNLNTASYYDQVEAIDGMIMITQYDVPWREDLFQEWDFYDASQSFEFRRRGHLIVVPHQKESWCMHDCGPSKLKNYDKNRAIFVREYIKEDVDDNTMDISVHQPGKMAKMDEICERFARLIDARQFEAVEGIIKGLPDDFFYLGELSVMRIVFEIHALEKSDEERDYGFFVDSCDSWDALLQLYREIRYLLRRLEQGHTGREHIEPILTMCYEKKLSMLALYVIARHTLFEWEKVLALLMR